MTLRSSPPPFKHHDQSAAGGRPHPILRDSKRAVERGRRANVHRPSVEPRTAAARRDKQFALERGVHYGKLEKSAMLVANRHIELRKAMCEIGGAVEWIDNPSMFAPLRIRRAPSARIA